MLFEHRPRFLRRILRFLPLFVLVPVLLRPGTAFRGACSGLLLWFNVLLPTLLPFMILSDLIQSLGLATTLISRLKSHCNLSFLYPLFFGLLSGLPLGAKFTADAVRNGQISRQTGQFLLTVCNNSSMMFLMGYLAEQSLQLPHLKFPICLIILLSSLVSAVICRFLFPVHSASSPSTVSSASAASPASASAPTVSPASASASAAPPSSSGQSCICSPVRARTRFIPTLNTSIMDSFRIITQIGGYVILFSVCCEYLTYLPSKIQIPLSGLMEITTGIRVICSSSLPESIKIILSIAAASFTGLSGIAQTGSMLHGTGLSLSRYIISRVVGCFLCIAVLILLR